MLALIRKVEILGTDGRAPVRRKQKQDKYTQRKAPAARAFYIVV